MEKGGNKEKGVAAKEKRRGKQQHRERKRGVEGEGVRKGVREKERKKRKKKTRKEGSAESECSIPTLLCANPGMEIRRGEKGGLPLFREHWA